MKQAFEIYRRLIGVRIRAQMADRASFFFEAFTTLFLNLSYILSLALVFQKFGNIGGWTLGQVAFLYGAVETAFGLMDMIFSGFDPSNFGVHVRQGLLDQMLLRPVDLTLQVLSSDLVLRRIGRITQGVAVLIVGSVMAEIAWTPAKVLFLPLVIAGMVCFFGGLFIIGATTTFWTFEANEAINIFTYGGAEMMTYPMHIYPTYLRNFFTYVVPAIFLNYYPALFFLDKPDPLGMPAFAPALAPLVGVGILWLSLRFWHFGLSHYQSTGT